MFVTLDENIQNGQKNLGVSEGNDLKNYEETRNTRGKSSKKESVTFLNYEDPKKKEESKFFDENLSSKKEDLQISFETQLKRKEEYRIPGEIMGGGIEDSRILSRKDSSSPTLKEDAFEESGQQEIVDKKENDMEMRKKTMNYCSFALKIC